MNNSYSYLLGVSLILLATFITAVSQIMLKKSAQKTYKEQIAEYVNPLVIGGYILLLGTTLISVLALRFIPMTLAAALDSTGQIFVPMLSFLILKERINRQKLIGMAVIIIGLVIYFLYRELI